MSKKPSPKQHPPQADDEPVVLGKYLAEAAAVEQRRMERGTFGKSPMPEEKYDLNSSELGLLRLRKVQLDSTIAELTREFAKAGEPSRAAIRDSISMDEFYTLLAFSRRAAVLALRERSIDWITDGLNAVAMIECKRVDWRDILVSLSLLNYAAERLGADAHRLFHDAGQLCQLEVSQLVDGFISRNPEEKSLRRSWGYDEVEVDSQVGFVGWGFRAYHPTVDLAKAAIEIADFITKDKYQATSIEIATELPSVWLETEDNRALQRTLKGVRACASISAELRADMSLFESQMFIVFLVETTNDSDACTLLKLSQQKNPESYAMLGVAEKNLFCLVVARSWVQRVESFETANSLKRFSHGLTDILCRHCE